MQKLHNLKNTYKVKVNNFVPKIKFYYKTLLNGSNPL
jgi:hypothetical protein